MTQQSQDWGVGVGGRGRGGPQEEYVKRRLKLIETKRHDFPSETQTTKNR